MFLMLIDCPFVDKVVQIFVLHFVVCDILSFSFVFLEQKLWLNNCFLFCSNTALARESIGLAGTLGAGDAQVRIILAYVLVSVPTQVELALACW